MKKPKAKARKHSEVWYAVKCYGKFEFVRGWPYTDMALTEFAWANKCKKPVCVKVRITEI